MIWEKVNVHKIHLVNVLASEQSVNDILERPRVCVERLPMYHELTLDDFSFFGGNHINFVDAPEYSIQFARNLCVRFGSFG